MSAVVGEPAAGGSQKYVNFDEYVDFQVNKTRAGIRYTDLLLAVVTVMLVVAGYLLLFVVADQWVIEGGFSDWTRTGLLAAVVAFIGGWTTWKIVLPYWKRVTALYAAKELEGTQPQLKSSLLTLVDLKQAGRPVSPHILTAMEKRAALQLSQIDVEQAVDRRPLMRLAYALLGVVVALCLYTVLSPKPVGASLLRALIPVADIGVATRTQIVKVDPGATSILARSQLEVTVDVKGEIPPEATLLYTTHDHSLVDEAIVLRDTGEGLNRFRGMLAGPNGRGLLQDFTYRVAAGDAESETFAVSVKQAPYATIESVTYTYPQYMGLDPQTQSAGEIDAWEGTKVTLRGVTNMPVAAATLKFHDTEDTSVKAEELPLRLVDSTHFELTWTLQFRRDGTFAHFYQVDLRTEEGQRDPVPRLYSQTIRRDLPPEIKLLHPSGDMELPANAVLPLSFAARDPDFMLRSIRLRFEQRDAPIESRTRHLFDAPPYRSELQGQGEIKLSDFESIVKPGDVLTFYLEAWDNMAPLDREGNRSVTPKINITITGDVSKEEVEQRREEEAKAAQQRLEEAQPPQTAESGDTEQPQEDPAGDDQPTEPAADENQHTEPSDAGEQTSSEQQPNEKTADGEQSTGQQNAESSDAQDPQGAQQQQQQQPGEQTPQGSEQQTPGEGKSGQQSKSGNAQSSQTGAGNQQKTGEQKSGEQAGSQQGTQQQRSQPQPGAEASDDEALSKLLDKYNKEIKQQREQEQQAGESGQDPQQGGKSQEGDKSSANQQQQSGDQANDGSESESGEPNQTGNEKTASSDGARSRPDATKPDENGASKPQNPDGENGEQNGDPASSAKPESQPKQPGDEPQPGEKPQTPGSKRDPRETQDPRTADQQDAQRGKPQPKTQEGEQQKGSGDQSQPMTGESDSSQSKSPSGQKSKGPGSPSENPSSDQPAGENAPPQNGDEGRPSNEDANQTGDPEQSGANDPNSSEPSKTGGQPKGADEQNPGEGRQGGQRSDQPQTGEKGSSQQTNEGQKSSQSGAGESSDSPGSKNEGESGQSSPGEGKPAGDQPGQSQSGEGSKSQSGQGGSKPSESGDPSQSGSEGSQGSQGSEQGAGSESKPGEKPASEADSNKSENKGNDQRGQPKDPQSAAGEEQPGESGDEGEGQKSGERQKSGNEQSGGGGEKPQSGDEAGDKPSESGGGGKQGNEKQGGNKQEGGEQGNKPEEGGQQGGSESSGSESGSQSGGEQSGGEQSGGGESGEGSSSSTAPGNSQKPGQPGKGQQSGGRVGAGGRGTNEGLAPQGSGDAGSSEAGPSEPGDLRDKKKATELVLQKLQDEISRGEVSEDLLKDLGWTEQNLRDFMDRLDRRLSDTGEDQSPEATARRRQFDEILRGIDYQSEGLQKSADGGDRPVSAGAGPIPRLPAPSEFRRAEESFRQKLSRETKSK